MEFDNEYVKIFDGEWMNPCMTILYSDGTRQIINDVYDVQLKYFGASVFLVVVDGIRTFYINIDKIDYYSIENGE